MEKVLVKSSTPTLMEELQRLRDRTARRAFELFNERGGMFGRDTDDWLNAEREFLTLPEIEVFETSELFTVKAALPGFEGKDVEVFVEPKCVTIKGKREEEKETEDKKITYSEFRYGQILREFELPVGIDPGKAEAEMKGGILTITLPKTDPAPKKRRLEIASRSAA